MNEEYKIVSRSENETMEIAENLESEKFPGMVICLEGELGSGKTVFAKGFARALGIEDTITSPTFNLVKEYSAGEMELYHLDVYRLTDDPKKAGIDDYFNRQGVALVEWSDTIKDILPENRLEIKFRIIDENTRVIILKPYGQQYDDLCQSVI